MVLTETDFLKRVKERIGDDVSDEAISFLEDMTDTYKDLSENSGLDWKAKYDALDGEWRRRYMERFSGETNTKDREEADQKEEGETVLSLDDVLE